MQPHIAVRAGWGAALLVAPGVVWAGLGVTAPGPVLLGLSRVLGARHLAQAAVTATHPPGPVGRALAAGVDVLHAGTDVAYAAVEAGHRRVVLVDAAVALGLAAAGWRGGRRERTTEPTSGLISGLTGARKR